MRRDGDLDGHRDGLSERVKRRDLHRQLHAGHAKCNGLQPQKCDATGTWQNNGAACALRLHQRHLHG